MSLSFRDLHAQLECSCDNCGYFCTLPLGATLRRLSMIVSHQFSGHPQQFHETSHGSMSKARWAIDGPAGTTLEVDGHKYGSEDDGAPMMCNLVCSNLGRHVHLDYCRTKDGRCAGTEVCHVEGNVRFNPNPNKPKDWISHSLFWRRSGMILVASQKTSH